MAHDIRHQRAVAWPHIAVAVARILPDIAIGGGDDRSVVVNLRPRDEQAAAANFDIAVPEA